MTNQTNELIGEANDAYHIDDKCQKTFLKKVVDIKLKK